MTSTNWGNPSTLSTNYTGVGYQSLLGALMNNATYTMNSTLVLMNDQTTTVNTPKSTNFATPTTTSTSWT